MFGTQNLGLFISAGLLLNVTPGQDTMYIVGRSMAQGRRAGVVSALGISTGSLVHTVVAAAGLAALLAASPLAFGVIRWAGGRLPGIPGTGIDPGAAERPGGRRRFIPRGCNAWAIAHVRSGRPDERPEPES